MAKISVCMACFNGEKYIRQQLQSILAQLGDDDEVIVSDDSSTDNTVPIIKEFGDPRIKLYEGQSFRSPIYNTGFCISKSTGSLIYLADQDDFWLPDKVRTIAAVFRERPEVMLVATDGLVVDEKGEVLHGTLYWNRGGFSSSVFRNLVRNRFFGCTLVFRKEMIPLILPMPTRLPVHDVWIGVICKLFGRVHYIDKPLVAYRRHAANFTKETHAGLVQMTVWRIGLAGAVGLRAFQHLVVGTPASRP